MSNEPNLGGYGDVVYKLDWATRLLEALIEQERMRFLTDRSQLSVPKATKDAIEFVRGMKNLNEGKEWDD